MVPLARTTIIIIDQSLEFLENEQIQSIALRGGRGMSTMTTLTPIALLPLDRACVTAAEFERGVERSVTNR